MNKKFVGRDQLPSDEVAFNRLAKVFSDPTPGPINSQRRQRVDLPNGKTKLSTKGEDES